MDQLLALASNPNNTHGRTDRLNSTPYMRREQLFASAASLSDEGALSQDLFDTGRCLDSAVCYSQHGAGVRLTPLRAGSQDVSLDAGRGACPDLDCPQSSNALACALACLLLSPHAFPLQLVARKEVMAEAVEELQHWTTLVSYRVMMQLPPGLVRMAHGGLIDRIAMMAVCAGWVSAGRHQGGQYRPGGA